MHTVHLLHWSPSWVAICFCLKPRRKSQAGRRFFRWPRTKVTRRPGKINQHTNPQTHICSVVVVTVPALSPYLCPLFIRVLCLYLFLHVGIYLKFVFTIVLYSPWRILRCSFIITLLTTLQIVCFVKVENTKCIYKMHSLYIVYAHFVGTCVVCRRR